MCRLTSVSEMNQRSQRLWIHALHLDLLLFRLPYIIGEHGRKIVRHGAQNQPATTGETNAEALRETFYIWCQLCSCDID